MKTILPGPLAPHWEDLAVNSALNAKTDGETAHERIMMEAVHESREPALVKQDGSLDFNAPSNVSCSSGGFN